MIRRKTILIAVAVLVMMLVLPACATGSDSDSREYTGPIGGTWVDVEVDGSRVALSQEALMDNVNVHFSVYAGERKMDFMAYVLDDDLHVRANACPPCRSIGFALDGSILVCDMCQTTFAAGDGSGIEGACVDYPKAPVAYSVEDGLVVMTTDNLIRAYDETLVAG